MNDLIYSVMLVLVAIGFLCLGIGIQQSRTLYWRIKWIEMEHSLARLEGREPRNIKDCEINFAGNRAHLNTSLGSERTRPQRQSIEAQMSREIPVSDLN